MTASKQHLAAGGLRRIADNVPFIIWSTDPTGTCTFLNTSAAAHLEDIKEFSLDAWGAFVHPEDLSRLYPLYKEMKASRAESQLTYRIVRSDGSIRWVLGSGVPNYGSDGAFLGYSGAITDVTGHHELLEKHEKSEASFRLLAENSSDLITHLNAAGVHMYASPSSMRIVGFKPEEVVGLSIYDMVHPDDVAILRQEVHNQLVDKAPSQLIEFRGKHKDGHYLWFGSKLTVLVDEATGAKLGSVAVSRDITHERLLKDALGTREERFRSLTHLSSDWFWETDADDRFTFLSEGLFHCLGVTPESRIGKKRSDLVADVEQPGLVQCMEAVQRREKFRDIRYVIAPAGNVGARWVSVSGEPVFRDGSFIGYRGISRDVTDSVDLLDRFAKLAMENKAVVDNALDMMLVIDAAGLILRANPAAETVTGYPPEEMVGKTFVSLLPPAERGRALQIFNSLQCSGKSVHDIENKWVRKDGSLVYLAWSCQHQPDGIVYATARDVSERHHSRQALEDNNAKLVTTLESLGQGFMSIDRSWRIRYANEIARNFAKRSPDAFVGKLLWEAAPGIRETEVFKHYKHAMDTGRTVFTKLFYAPANAWAELRVFPHPEGISVFFADVTAQHETEVAFQKSQQRVNDIIEMTPAGYVLSDKDFNIVDVNPALCLLTGWSRPELVGKPLTSIFKECPVAPGSARSATPSRSQGLDCSLLHKNGEMLDVLANSHVERDANGKLEKLSFFLTDITERKQAEKRLHNLATRDTLTGLPNRAHLNERLQQMLLSPRDQEIAVMFIDLDRFKEVNDTLGHECGDTLLKHVSCRLQNLLRAGDIVARLGGDEFIVAAYCTKGEYSAMRIAEKLKEALAAPVVIGDQEIYVGASIGISMFPQDATTKEELFQNADAAMYAAKNGGRNNFRFFKGEMGVEAKRRVYIEQSLRKALDRGEFELHYQPRLSLPSQEVIGVEALIRWRHPELGMVPPSEFIPIAEERGYIEPIGLWVLERACEQVQSLSQQTGVALHVSVNVSAKQLRNRRLIPQVRDILKKSGLPANLLELELTESALIEDIDGTVAKLKELKKLGLTIAVDDFGTGYCGLTYLRKFPIDTMKLDRSFIQDTGEGQNAARFVEAFVDMAHALNLSVVAEGIETPGNLSLVADAACDEVQGYLFAKPMPFNDLLLFVAAPSNVKAPE